MLGKDLTLSDAAGIAALLALDSDAAKMRTALSVFIEFRDNSIRNNGNIYKIE